MENNEISHNRMLSKYIYFEPQELSDGKLITEDEHTFNIHKFELAKHSKYFYRLFCGIGKGKNEFFIPGIGGEVLGNILSYIYTEKVIINELNICDIIIAADYLLVDAILKHIEDTYMKDCLTINNCLSVLSVAFHINQKNIFQKSFRFVQTHFEDIVGTKNSEFCTVPLDVLKQLLCMKSLYVRDENSVWLAIVRWVEFDTTQRLFAVPDLLACLALSDVDEDLASKILEHEIVAQNQFCEKINQVKLSSSCNINLNILSNYIKTRSQLSEDMENHRMPYNLHFIAHFYVHGETEGVHIYVTYDENIDLWRKIFEIDVCPDFIISIDHIIYMFQPSENRNYRFNIVGKELNAIANFRTSRNYYGVVQLGGLIYILGGTSIHTGGEIDEVEVYDPAFELWLHAAPMIPVTSFNAVALGRNIYVVGIQPGIAEPEMMTQIYDSHSDSWTILSPPSFFRFQFALVVYRGGLCVIGGRNEEEYLRNVEVFDSVKEEWTTSKDLPHVYYLPKAIVLNDCLIVYDNHLEDRSYMNTNPAVMWDEVVKDWKPFEESSPMNALHKYCFFNTDNKDCIKNISRENRDPKIQFAKSPFTRN